MLETVGIGVFDEQVYRALLRQPEHSTAELGARIAVAPARVRASLRRLEALGLVRRTGARGFVPIAPETALTTLLHRREAELQTEFDAVRAAIDELTRDYRTGDVKTHPAGLIEVDTDTEAINRRSYELWQSATKEILAFEKPPYPWEDRGSWQRSVPAAPVYDEVEFERPLLERGVRIRGLYQRDALEAPGRLAVVTRLAELGEDARTLPRVPIKLHVYDRRVGMVPLTSDLHASRAIVHASGLLDALIALFEAYWERAHPIAGPVEPAPEAGGGQLDDKDAAVLRMLAAGMKDETISRQLGVSRRTATRQVERILARLDASSRFQAGAEAARRGWL